MSARGSTLIATVLVGLALVGSGCGSTQNTPGMGGAPIPALTQVPRVAPSPPPLVTAPVIPAQPPSSAAVAEKTFDLGHGVKLEMVWVAPGSFTMGSPSSEAGRESNETQHSVTLTKGYWMGKYEVTQGQWEQVMGSNPLEYGGKDWPVVDVSWDDCKEFIQKLNAKLSSEGGGFRLPTEVEWEYACRAGSTTKYCFGDDESRLGEYAWFVENSQCTERPVGGKKPNAWGLHDMHGNVWEWCEDRYGEKSPVEDPRGPSSAPARVWRGGSWTVDARLCRSAFRDRGDPSLGGCDFGFRVVRE